MLASMLPSISTSESNPRSYEVRKSIITGTAIALSLAVAGIAQADTASAKTVTHKVCKIKHGQKFCKFVKNGKKPLGATPAMPGPAGSNGVNGTNGVNGMDGTQGPMGPKGDKGLSGLEGAFYAVAKYDHANAGAIATVACDSNPANINYTAIAGGVQMTGIGDNNSNNTPVSSSFPGRMDWSINKPRPNRLDGWIVQFGGNAGAQSDRDPMTVNVWALCVPRTDIPVKTTFTEGR